MSNNTTKTFDAVQMVRTVRDELSSAIATMSVEEENRWLRSEPFADPTLQRLRELSGGLGAVRDSPTRGR